MNPSTNRPLIIGVFEVIAGFLLIATATLVSSPPHWVPLWLFGILSNLGIGLIAAGIITGSLERVSRKRLQDDITEIKSAHFESILKGFMPAPIFEEVRTHIIGQPFIRKDYRWTFEFAWKDEDRKYVHAYFWVYYEVENLSRTSGSYELQVSQERTREDLFSGIEYFKEIRIDQNGKKPIKYSSENLKKRTKEKDQYVEVSIPLPLEPTESAEVYIYFENILPSRDVFLCASNRMSDHFELIVNHPVDLDVQATPYHPSRDKFKTLTSTPRLKHWKIQAGVLPYQGIELSWRPKVSEK